MFYLNGDLERWRSYYESGSPVEWIPLRFSKLFRLRESDVLGTVRAWDAVAWYFARRHPSERPVIVQFADGHVSELNCRKTVNVKGKGALYAPLLADVFVTFNRSVRTCVTPADQWRVRSVRPGFYTGQRRVEGRSRKNEDLWVVASGMDPFFGHEHEVRVVDAYQKVLNEGAKRGKRMVYALGSERLARALRRLDRKAQVGKLREVLMANDSPELVFTTPSTIALEMSARNVPVCVIDCWRMDTNFPKSMVWRSEVEDVNETLRRVRHSYLDLRRELFGSLQVMDVIGEIQRQGGDIKVDLRAAASKVRLSMRDLLGSVR
jgi:hypothetical protein